MAELQAELRGQIARTLAMDDRLDGDAVQEAYEEGRKSRTSEARETACLEDGRNGGACAKVPTLPPLVLRADRRMRYWSDGLIIGSKGFVREVGANLFGEARAKRQRFGKGQLPAGDELFSFRKLQADL